MFYGNKEFDVRISEKPTLSLLEAAAYTGIGIQRLIRISNVPNCNFVLFVGRKRMFKRIRLEEYLDSQYSM
jgi:hypothetical protein